VYVVPSYIGGRVLLLGDVAIGVGHIENIFPTGTSIGDVA
jgi:hypothetical protein